MNSNRDVYGHGFYGSYYGNSPDQNRSREWNEDDNYSHERSQQPRVPRSHYGNYEGRYHGNQSGHSQNQTWNDRYGNRQGSYSHQPDFGSSSNYGSRQGSDSWPHYHDNDGYAHGRPFIPEDRGWLDRTADEVRSWFGDDEAERRRRMDHYDEDAYPRDYYGRRFRKERLQEEEARHRAAYPVYGPPYGPNVGSEY